MFGLLSAADFAFIRTDHRPMRAHPPLPDIHLMNNAEIPPGRPPRSLCSYALSLTLLTPGLVLAQTNAAPPAEEPQEPAQLETIKVTGANTVEQRRAEITNRIVINRTDILKHNDDSLSSVMRRLPGITVSPTDGIRMRGLGAGYVQILVDGTPVAADFSIDSISPELIERIEILPTAVAEYSTRSIAGTINIVLRKHARSTQRVLKFSAGQDGAGWHPSISLLLTDKREDFTWSLTANAARTTDRIDGSIVDSAFDASGTQTALRVTRERYDSASTTVSIAPRLNWIFDNNDTLSWQSLVQYDDDQWERDRRETAILGGASEFPYNRWINHSRTWSGRTDLDWVHNISTLR